MKRIFAIAMVVALVLISGLNSTRAQDTKEFKFDIKTNIFSAATAVFIPYSSEYRLVFEAKTFKKQSVQVGLSYLGPSFLINSLNSSIKDSTGGVSASGFRAQIWYKFFITSDEAPKGFYVGPYYSYATFKMTSSRNSSDYVTGKRTNAAVVTGYQFLSKGGFAFDIYVGLGIKTRHWTAGADGTEFNMDDLNQLKPIPINFGFNFGYAF